MSPSLSPILPVDCVEDWRGTPPMLMRLASWLNRTAPRGKGAIPRMIGRRFGRKWKTTITTDSGCVLAVDPCNLDLFVTIENEGSWEPWIRRACIRAMRPGDVMFDVGANAGAISNETARGVPGITIKAFEPQRELAELVAISARINGHQCIDVFPVAVGDQAGTVQLHKPAHALHASLRSSGESGEQVVDVPIVRLDHVVESGELPPPSLIKIDVEGGEMGVLRGAMQILRDHQPIVIFEANESSDRFGYGREALLSLIRQCGDYRFFSVAPGDVMACPPERVAEFEEYYPQIPFDERTAQPV